ncbi:MAG: hypothetical protein ACKVVT_15150 [Dehalococcoidia bacterium]
MEPGNSVTLRALAGPVGLPALKRDPWALSFELQTPITAARLAETSIATATPSAAGPAKPTAPAPVAAPATAVRHVVDDFAEEPVREPLRLPGRAA